MGRRVLTVSELTFHQKRKRNPESYAPADLEGEDLLEVFEAWVNGIDASQTHNEKRQTWVSVKNVVRYAPRVVLLLDLLVGAYGEPGEVVDTSTGKPVGQIEDHEAPTGQNRALLFVPEHGERAYFLSEESSRGSAGGRILRLFKSHFSQFTNRITMETSTVSESEAWRDAAELTEVEVRVTGKSSDVADGLTVRVGRISYIARPEKKQRFPGNLLDALRRTDVAAEVVSVNELPEDHDVFVTMTRDGRSKKFQLGTEVAPAIRELLNDSDKGPLTTATLVETCTEKVRELSERTGGEWDTAWSVPTGQGA
ncbi:hypothetical protein OVA21_19140 [Dietzia sp. SL131]|uniref:hypothetical protein n=1 Tax=Dietzia sp. SL131 TaxID=2995149 RepID=UPI00227AB9BC|nr:hypothetical protein [Dietzia sp. SL131]MCY1659270.1 hypothetical protein [Dietzia sp. SL131]